MNLGIPKSGLVDYLIPGNLAVELQILLFGPIGHAGTTYTGKVISITDGDTLRILCRDGQLKLRLAEIDTPERKQPRVTRAKQALSGKSLARSWTSWKSTGIATAGS